MGEFRASYSYHNDDGNIKTTYETFEAESMNAARGIASYIQKQKGYTLHGISELSGLDNSGIMKSGGDENASSQRVTESRVSPAATIPAERRSSEGEVSEIPEREQTAGIQETGEGKDTGRISEYDGEDVQTHRREPDGGGSVGERSLESGYQAGDTGERERLGSVNPGAIETSEPHDIILNSNDDIGTNMGAAARFDANLIAIRTLKDIESENRKATPAEQSILAKYSGFGDSQFNPAFEHYYGRENEAWKRRGDELKALTTEDEYKAIASSRLNAFYTTPEVVKAIWKGLDHLGVDNIKSPHILEPSAGSGRFLGFQPTELAARSQRTAVELDSLTGRMLKHTYPQSDVYVTGFESAPLPKDSFDMAISNVPFGNYPVFDPSFKKQRAKLKTQIHNYFFAKTLERLRPGGVLAFITSHGTLDAPTSQPQRELMAQEADLIGAIRLPRTAFPDTEVCTDIIYMRKRNPGDPPGDKSWTETQSIELQGEYNKIQKPVNKYFIQHPEMVLGEHSVKGTMRRGEEYTVDLPAGTDLSTLLAKATSNLPANIISDMPPLPPRSIYSDAAINVRENCRVVDEDGTVRIKRNGMLEKADYNTGEAERVRQMLKIRDAARKVLQAQLEEKSESELADAQAELNTSYNEFTGAYGALRNKDNSILMKSDPDGPFILALEKGQPQKKENKPAWVTLNKAKKLTTEQQEQAKTDLFSRRTIKGLGFREISNETDALSFVYNETGRLDFDRMVQLLGKSDEDIIKKLSSNGRIYRNPVGDWEIASQYLSGDVREKLRAAEMAADANPRYKPNVTALKSVQPADLKPSEINVSLGAPWIPSSDVNDFVKEILRPYGWRGGDNYFAYVPQTGQWITGDKIEADSTLMSSEWGTHRMPASKLIEDILNGKLVEVKDKVTDDDGKETSVRNSPETITAQEKAQAIERKFHDWIWENPERTERLLKYYNDTYNCRKSRQYDGSHMELPGMADQWARQIHSHQKDAIWRVVQDRTALLAHEVGFGKTAVMVAAGMELRRLGLSRKNIYVVPKPTHAQFQEQFAEIYPYANVLAPQDDDFSASKRAEFMSRIATNDWDAVILSNEQFRRLPLKPETEARFLEDEIASYEAALAMTQQGDDDSGWYRRKAKDKAKEKTQKQIEQAIKVMRVKLQNLQEKTHSISDKAIFFEDLGVDQIFVDEADNFKNLQFATQMGRIKGLPNTASDRAWDMYGKTRYLQEQGKGHGVVFATGTPVANTIAEMYTMMRYLQQPMLESKGLQHFDAWAKTFGETTESLEQTPSGGYKMTQRFAKFQNAPELSQLWQDVADIRVADEVPGMMKLRPRLVDESGKERRTVVAIQPDDALKRYMEALVERADNMKNVDPRDDNMLKLSNDARKAALDVRMVDPTALGNPDGKVATAARNVAKIYNETTPDKGLQLIFLDLGTPKAKEKIEDNKDEVTIDGQIDEDEETAEEKKYLENVYATLKDSLVAEGVPREHIAFIHDAKTDEQKKLMQAKARLGDIRVLVGSTAKLGVGVNVQDRAAALHHMDAPWRPRDIEQREGRIIRQGNRVYGPKFDENHNIIDPGPGVKIFNYVTEGSFDGYMWQAIEAKSKAIKSIMRRENPPRAIEDCDSFTMSASEAKAIASGNPDVMKQVTLKNSVTKLQMLKSSYLDSKVRAKDNLKRLPDIIKELETKVSKSEKDAVKASAEAEFALNIGGSTIVERPEASEIFKKSIEGASVETNPEKANKIARYKGFDVYVSNLGAAGGYGIRIENPDTGMKYTVAASIPYNELTTGVLTRVENTIKKIPTEYETAKRDLEQNRNNLKGYEKQAEAKFEYEDRLNAMEKELDRLSRKLQGEKVEDTPSDIYVGEEDIPETTPAYRFTPKEPELEQHINPQVEIKAVEATIEPHEETLEVKDPTKEDMKEIDTALKDMGKPAPIISTEVAEKIMEVSRKEGIKSSQSSTEQPPVTAQATQAGRMKVMPESDITVLKSYGQNIVSQSDIKSVDLIGSSVEKELGQGNDIDIIYDFGNRNDLPLNSGEAEDYMTNLIESQAGINIDLYDTFLKVNDRYFHISSGAGRQVIENTEYGKEQSNKPKINLSSQPPVTAPSTSVQPVESKSEPTPLALPAPKVEKLAKPEKEKRQRKIKLPVTTLSRLKQRQAERTPRAQAMDLRRKHSITVEPVSPRTETWLKHPGRMDVTGIDTPHSRISEPNPIISESKVPISEHWERLPRGIGRISPKMPRLK